VEINGVECADSVQELKTAAVLETKAIISGLFFKQNYYGKGYYL